MSQYKEKSPHHSRLVYATGPDGIYSDSRSAQTVEHVDSDVTLAAHDLAAMLEVGYAQTMTDVLGSANYNLPVSQKVAAWVIGKGLHEPSVDVLTINETVGLYSDPVYDYIDDRGSLRAALKRQPKPGSAIVRFVLPKPIDQFIGRTDHDGRAATWGAVYERAKHAPWRALEQWQQQNPDFSVSRLNSVGLHVPGADGFYYLFEVSGRISDEEIDANAGGLYAQLLGPSGADRDTAEPVLLDYMQQAVDALNDQGLNVHAFAAPEGLMQMLHLDELPQGVAVIGGAARAILQQTVFGEHADVRDVDLVAVNELLLGDVDTDQLSREFMEDDYYYGHGVSHTDLDQYFTTRDFTMNEVLVVDGILLATERAVQDLQGKIIRPTDYEAKGWESGIGPKLAMKALLMQAIFEQKYGSAQLEGFEPYQASGFYVALALNKAFQYGLPVTRRFLQLVGFTDRPDVDEITDYARQLADQYNFQFRGSALARLVSGEYLAGDDKVRDIEEQIFDDLPPAIEHATRLMELKGTNRKWGDTGY